MDISEVVEFGKFLLPPAAFWMIDRAARAVRYRWLRVSIRVTSILLFVVSGFLVAALLVVQAACSQRAPPLYSPDGRHVAVLRYALQGALGDDYAIVDVRSRWVPWAHNVYRNVGSRDFENGRPADPEMRWLGDHRLLIRSHWRTDFTSCLHRSGAVEVICEYTPARER